MSNYSGTMKQDSFGEYPIEADGSFIPQRDAPRGDLINSKLSEEIQNVRITQKLIEDTFKLIDTLTGQLHKFFSLNANIISNLDISRAKTEYSFEVQGEKIKLKFLGFEGYSLNNSNSIHRNSIEKHLYIAIANIYLKQFGIVFPKPSFTYHIISRFTGSKQKIKELGITLGFRLHGIDTIYLERTFSGIKLSFGKGGYSHNTTTKVAEIDFYEFISKLEK